MTNFSDLDGVSVLRKPSFMLTRETGEIVLWHEVAQRPWAGKWSEAEYIGDYRFRWNLDRISLIAVITPNDTAIINEHLGCTPRGWK